MLLLENQRDLFDIPSEIAYFNCAYNAPLLNKAASVLVSGALSKRHPWLRKPADFFEDAESFRQLASQALGGSKDCYAVIPSASYGIATVARIFERRLSSSDEIVVLAETFPSNYLSWKRLTQLTGARIVIAPRPNDSDWTKAVLSRINMRTALVAVPNCHWTDGSVLDLEVVADAVRSAKATLVLEVTQSLGAMPLHIDRVQPDFIVAAGYKWLLFPYGLSIFYAAPRWHDARPLEETWLNRAEAQIFESLADYAEDYQSGARRFEMGQKCAPSLLPGGLAALEQIGSWGVARIATRLEEINDRIAEVISEVGLTPVPKANRSPHILGATAPRGLPSNLIPMLAERDIYISRRGNALRFSPHLHVTDRDIGRLCESLHEFLERRPT